MLTQNSPPTESSSPLPPHRYAFNIVFNIVNKSTLNVFPCPWFLSTLQLGCGVIIMGVLWGTK